REERHLHGERDGKGEEEPELQVRVDVDGVELEQVEAVLASVAGRVQRGHAENRQQHQHAGGHGVEDELDRRVDAPLVAPDADQEIHRHQHGVPEHVEQKEVERHEDAHHRAFEQQHEDAERPGLLVHRSPRAQERQRGEEPGEDEQQQADAVDADEVVDAERRNPRVALDELEVARGRVEAAPQQQRLGKDQQRDREGDLAGDRRALLFVAGDEKQYEGANERQRDDRSQNRKVHHRDSEVTETQRYGGVNATGNTPG